MCAGFKYSWVVMSPAIIALTTSPIVTELPSHLWSPTGCPPLSPGGRDVTPHYSPLIDGSTSDNDASN